MKWHNPFSRLSVWYFSKKTLPYWGIILLDCLSLLFSGLVVYALNNGLVPTASVFWHLSLTLVVCLVPYLVGFRLFHTYSGIIRYSSFVDLQRVGFATLFGAACVVAFQELTDFSPWLVYQMSASSAMVLGFLLFSCSKNLGSTMRQ